MNKIKIIKHLDPKSFNNGGDILYPFESWDSTDVGGGWYSRLPESFYEDKKYFPLNAVHENSWEALIKLGVDCFDFKERVQYECPYNKYIHFWCVPILIFSEDIKPLVEKSATIHKDTYLDHEMMKKYYPAKVNGKLPFSKIQRALLGPGYTFTMSMNDGNGYLYDSIIALDNGDFLGAKVWMWFNR